MYNPLSVRIPAGKLGTVRVDRTIDVYPISSTNNEIPFNTKVYIPTLKLQHQSVAEVIPFNTENFIEERSYIPKTKWNYSNDDDESDIAIIYSVVRRASTRRTSSPGICVLPLSPNFNIPQAHAVKTYTLEPPLTPHITHISRQAEIKNLLSIDTNQLLPPLSSVRIQTSNSFTSHDRPSLPTITIKPRPSSFRTTGFSLFEKQITNITERVSQLQETFFSRISHTPNQQRNRSLSTFQTTNTHISESNTLNINFPRPRPKSENYDDHHRIKKGKLVSMIMIIRFSEHLYP